MSRVDAEVEYIISNTELDFEVYQNLSQAAKRAVATKRTRITKNVKKGKGINFLLPLFQNLLEDLTEWSSSIHTELKKLQPSVISNRDLKVFLTVLKKDSEYIIDVFRKSVWKWFTKNIKKTLEKIEISDRNERRILVPQLKNLQYQRDAFGAIEQRFKEIENDVKKMLDDISEEVVVQENDIRQEDVKRSTVRRRRGRTPRARRARNNNILQNTVAQKVPSAIQNQLFTFFKIKRNRQQDNNMREPRLFDNKVDNDEEIVRKAVIVKEVDGGFKVGTIVYESMDQLQGDDVDKVRIYYLSVNGIKNIKKENLKTIRDNDSNIFVEFVNRDVISPIPENFDYDWAKIFSCINYAPSGAVIGYVPGQYRFLGATLIGMTGYLFYLKSIVTNEAELRKLEDEINRQSVFVTGYLGVEQEEKLLMQQKKCQGINFANIFSREMILALAMTNPVNVEKWVKKNLKKGKNIVMTIMSILNFSYTSYTEKFLRFAFFGTTAMTTVVATNKYVGTIYALRNLLDYAVSEGINYTEKYISFVTTTLANLARDVKRLLPLQYILKYIFDLISKVIPNGTAIKFISQIFSKDFVVNSVTTRALLGFDIQILAEILNYIFFLQSMMTLYTLMCPLLLWYSGQLENCAYQPRKKEKSELYKDLKF